MAEEAPESDTPNKDVKVEAPDMKSQIQSAMRSRVAHYKEQADSLTFEGVRRLLEKDLGLEAYALDVHKRFVKQCLLKILEGVGDYEASKSSGETGEENTSTQETEGSAEERQFKKDVKDRCPEHEEKMEDSPVLGLLKEQKQIKHEKEEAEGNGKKVVPSEAIIKKAIRKRASYIKANSEKVTMAGLRRLLEGDLKFDKYTLDPYKKFISQQLDEVLKSSEDSKPANSAKKTLKDKPDTKASKRVSSEDSSETSLSSETSRQESEEKEKKQDEVKPRKRSVPKGKMQNSTGLKKRKELPEEANPSGKKRFKPAKVASEDNSDAEDSGTNSEADQSSPEKPTKKKEVSTPVYGKHVEHLKSVIKACGMSVPPSIYKKAKQLPESKREAQLIKDMEEILSREALSPNPSEKDIKDVRRKKERAKELEGIDASNIVSSSRRRSTTSFTPPPKPKIPVETNGVDAGDSDDNDDDEGNDDEEDEEDEDDEDNSDDGSQSEEFNEDEEDSD